MSDKTRAETVRDHFDRMIDGAAYRDGYHEALSDMTDYLRAMERLANREFLSYVQNEMAVSAPYGLTDNTSLISSITTLAVLPTCFATMAATMSDLEQFMPLLVRGAESLDQADNEMSSDD